MTPHAAEPIAVVERSGSIESIHHGVIVVLGPDGAVVAQAGDPSTIVYPRSANKPFQAVGMLEAGLVLDQRLLAVACSSHYGTPVHLDAVRRLLGRFGLDESVLANTPDLPLDADAAAAILCRGGHPRPITQNCSGKHAAMVATCVVNGWPADASYLDSEHPLQQHLTAVIDRLVGEPTLGAGVDGCGAPAHRLSVLGLARAARAVALGTCGATGRTVAEAMTAHPFLVGGHRCQTSELMGAVPGLLVKEGAEGVMIAGLPDGGVVALKVADGAARARPVLMAAGLARLGVEVGSFEDIWRVPVFGHGQPVGTVKACGPPAAWLGESDPTAAG